MNVPLLDLKAQYDTIREKILASVNDVLQSQQFILGRQVAALETAIAKFCGVRHAIAVASGTDALLLSLKALGIGHGDSVVTVPFTFFATAGAIVNVGARPLFVDIEEPTFNMDPEKLALFLARSCTFSLTTQKLVHTASGTTIKALLPVHLYGQCAEMDEILKIARRYRLPVIEDACQTIGAKYHDRRAGTMGDLGCFSFFPSKNLGAAGDGGMVVTSSDDLAARVRLLRTHGAEPKYYHSLVGFNSRLDEIQAAILRVKLDYLEEWSRRRSCNAATYAEEFRSAGLGSKVRIPEIAAGRTHIFNQYVIRCAQRDDLKAFLKSKEIGTEIYYPVALHEQECFRYLGYSAQDLPRSTAAAGEVLALPIYPELTREQLAYVVKSIAEFYRQN